MLSFQLDKTFVNTFEKRPVEFGFNGLGEVLYQRSYSRVKELIPDIQKQIDAGEVEIENVEREKEKWFETCARVVNGVYSIQKDHIQSYNLGWDDKKAQASAQEMYERMFKFLWLPPGRGLFAMGTKVVHEKGLTAALYNCGFVSTADMDKGEQNALKPFLWLMDHSMLGVGVGFNIEGEDKLRIVGPDAFLHETYIIPDTREGWVESLRLQLKSHLFGGPGVTFDYDRIRKAGEPIKTFGGESSGPGPLMELHKTLDIILTEKRNEMLDGQTIVDIMNLIGKCVVSGNVRRSAEIVFGEMLDQKYINLKNEKVNPERNGFNPITNQWDEKYPEYNPGGWGWNSNNSVYAKVGSQYWPVINGTNFQQNGEPGFVWIDNCRAFGRTSDPKNHRDSKVIGLNPCGEITLESYELCNISETFPAKHDTLSDYFRTLKYSYLYSKTVTLLPCHWEETNRVQLRNRRIGVSQSGIVQAVEKLGLDQYRTWCDEGYKKLKHYDQVYSDWLAVPRSIKLTTVKPSGSVSILAGATPGVHWPISEYYIRRMRMGVGTELAVKLEALGYHVEPDVKNPKTTVVVEFPVHVEGISNSEKDVSVWQKYHLAAFMQHWWADNAVSCTITFNPETEYDQIVPILEHGQYTAKSLSFLPLADQGTYAQMPYEPITEEQYLDAIMGLKDKELDIHEDAADSRFCDSDTCVL